MIDVPSMLITPVACFTVFLGLVYYWVYVAAYLVSSGTLVLHGEPVTSNSTSISSSWTSSHVRSFTYDQHTRWMLIYHAFALLWNAAFLLDFGKLVVSSCVAIWYWAPNPLDGGRNWLPPLERMRTPALGADSKRAIDFNVFLQSVDTSLRFHIGSVAVGSFLQAACFAVRIVFEYARQQMADKSGRRPNCIARVVLCCVSCCLSCVESFIEFVSDNAYIQIAMFGGNFCQSASAGFRLLMRNPARMVVTGLVQSVLVFAGKVVVVTACAIFGVCMMYREHAADVATRTESVYAAAAYSLLPLCLVVFGAWLVCSVVFNIFVVAIQTMLQCVCEDEERNDGNQHPFFMSQELRHVLDNIDSNN